MVKMVIFFSVAASLCDFVVSLTIFLLSTLARRAISLEFSLLVLSESSPRKEMISCICAADVLALTWGNGIIQERTVAYKARPAPCPLEQIIHTCSLQLQLFNK